VNCAVVVANTVAEGGATVTVIAGTVIVDDATARELATEVAVTVTVTSLGGGAGAVYVIATPLAEEFAEIVPQGAVPQVTVQFTPLLPESPATVAVSFCVPVPATVAALGVTVTPTDGIVSVAVAVLLVSVTEVALIVTVKLLAGGVAGAVYVVAVPLGVVVGATVPQGAVAQLTVHVTPAFAGSPFTVGVSCAVVFTCTVAVDGEMLTVIACTTIGVLPFLVESATAVAVSVTVRSVPGAFAGAVYVVGVPLGVVVGETLPQGAVAQVTAQVTPALLASLFTVAVTCWAWPANIVPELAATVTVIAGTVIFAVPDLVGSATEVAVTVTVTSLSGGVVGAVYVVPVPLAVVVGETAPQGDAEHDTVQVTPLFFESPPTVALTLVVAPAETVVDVAKTDTLMRGAEPPPQP
jgi:hypothetical protein